MRIPFNRLTPRIVLLLILASAAIFRYAGNSWDSYQLLHPDERFLLMTVSSLKLPSGIGEYLDEARSPLNPLNHGHATFAYGTLPTTGLRAVSALLGLNDLSDLAALGRFLSATLDLGVVVWLYLLAMRLYRDRRIALLAAFFYAAAVLPIQQAHFFVVDPFLNFFLTAALYFLVRYDKAPGWRSSAAMGLFLALAMACKISAGLFVVAILGVYARQTRRAAPGRRGTAILQFLFVGLTGFAVFRLVQPEAFRFASLWNPLPSARWLNSLAETLAVASGEVDLPSSDQWAGRTPLLFPWLNMVIWGTGIAAGIAAWAGWAVAARRLLLGRHRLHLAPVLWIGGLFLYQGTRWIFTMRYFLPLYAPLFVLGAWLLVRWFDISAHHGIPRPPWWRRRGLALAACGFAAAASLFWALAFTAIYRTSHSRVAATRWIYAHLPKGTSLANEVWDDPLPLRMDGHDPFGGEYHGLDMRWYDEDTPRKLADALDWFDRTEYIILSSNRLSGSIPRLPARYPMTTLYYRALFDGRLGFDKVKEFTSFPRLGRIVIPTQTAEEAFTVYDHPVVMIFRKTSRYSRDGARGILGKVVWEDIVHAPARRLSKSPTGFMIPADDWRSQLQAASWNEIFPLASLSRGSPALALLLFLYLTSLSTAPLLFFACRRMPDRGYGFSKAAALLVTGWLAWLGASTPWIRFERPWIWTVAFLLAGAGAAAMWRQRREMAAFLRKRWFLPLASEAVFLLAFVFMAVLRRSNPDLWQLFFGGEKPMDFALLNAAVRAVHFPLYHPWFSGAFVNYYYFGFVLVATWLKAVAVPPEIGYNIMIPVLYGIAAACIFSLTYALIGSTGKARIPAKVRLSASAAGVAAVLVLGNLKQLALYVSAMARLEAGDKIDKLALGDYWLAAIRGLAVSAKRGWDPGVGGWVWYFDSTRAYNHLPGEPAPINEFPLFTFYFGDLHAHLMALPLFLLLLGLAASVAATPWSMKRTRLTVLGVAALAWGALPAVNTWDAPMAALVLGCAIWISCRSASPDSTRNAGTALCYWAGALAVGWLCFAPFHYWFDPGYGSIERWTGSQTGLVPFLLVHGLFLVVISAALWRATACGLASKIAAAALLATAIHFGQGVTALILVLLCAVGRVLYRERRDEPLRLLSLLLPAAGLLLVLAPEWVVLHGDVGRMNTVFKLTFQAWSLLGISAAVLAVRIAGDWRQWWKPARYGWGWAVALLVAGCLVYPLTAPRFRSRDRFDPSLPPGWDGMGFLRTASQRLCETDVRYRDDLGMIQWLRANVHGTPPIMEYNTDPVLYGWGNRISTYTGLPSVVGWSWHVRQQMMGLDAERVGLRIRDVQRAYQAGDPAETWDLLRRYRARYLIWGSLEKACAAAAESKFKAGQGRYWDVAYESRGTRIYRVRDSR